MNDLDTESPDEKKLSFAEEKNSMNISQELYVEEPINSIDTGNLCPSANPFRERSTSQVLPKKSPSPVLMNRSVSHGSSHKSVLKTSPNRSPLKMSPKRRLSQGSPKRSPSRLSPNRPPSYVLNKDNSLHDSIAAVSSEIHTPPGYEISYIPVLVPKSQLIPTLPSDMHYVSTAPLSDGDESYNRATIQYQKERLDTLINEMQYLEKEINELSGKNKNTKDSITKLNEDIKRSGFTKEMKISEEKKKNHLDYCIFKAQEQKVEYENLLYPRRIPVDDICAQVSTLEISGSDSLSWTCESCTFKNDRTSTSCAICLQPNYNKH